MRYPTARTKSLRNCLVAITRSKGVATGSHVGRSEFTAAPQVSSQGMSAAKVANFAEGSIL